MSHNQMKMFSPGENAEYRIEENDGTPAEEVRSLGSHSLSPFALAGSLVPPRPPKLQRTAWLEFRGLEIGNIAW